MKRENFLGYPVDSVSMEEALSWISSSISSKGTKTIAVINANKLWQAHNDIELSSFIQKADLVIPEYAVVWGASKFGIELTHIGGIMLIKAFLLFAQKNGIRPYFLGANDYVVQKMANKIKLDYPDLPIAGCHHGYLSDDAVMEEVTHDLINTQPDILFVAMGSPKQEYLMNQLRAKLNIPVLMGVGGSFDVLAGDKKDAPIWARSKGFEWLYRISQDPLNISYWRRYLITNTWFVWEVLKAKCMDQGSFPLK